MGEKKKKKKNLQKLLRSPAGDFHISTSVGKNLCIANALVLLKTHDLWELVSLR